MFLITLGDKTQIRRLVDTHVVGAGVAEPQGVYQVDRLGQEDPESWSEEKTRNEADLIRTRLTKTIEQSLEDDPYAQKVFSELLREAIDEANALFDHPSKQYALFLAFEQQVNDRELDTIPKELRGHGRAAACYGLLLLVLGDAFVEQKARNPAEVIELALTMDEVVGTATAEHSLNPSAREAAISKALLPTLFRKFGMEHARELVERLIQSTRAAPARQSA